MGNSSCVVGATGLVGRELVAQLCADPAFDVVHVLSRRPVDFGQSTAKPKLVSHLVDFDQLDAGVWPACQVLFCALGTTIKAAGSQAAFRAVDLDYVVTAARHAQQACATHLVVVSALGADQHSSVFYNRIKGEMEAAIAKLGFAAVTIVRPSLLSGKRDKQRAGERMALTVLKIANPLLPSRYRSVPAAAVARAMIAAAKNPVSGTVIIESDQLQEFA